MLRSIASNFPALAILSCLGWGVGRNPHSSLAGLKRILNSEIERKKKKKERKTKIKLRCDTHADHSWRIPSLLRLKKKKINL